MRIIVFMILLAELVVLIVLLLALIVRRFWVKYTAKKEEKDKQIISNLIIECLQKKTVLLDNTRLPKLASRKVLLPVMELFDRRLSGGDWEKLKSEIMLKCLLPKARRWSKNRAWTKRNFSARCFALCPQGDLTQEILLLVEDPEFLVRSFAAMAAIEIKSHDGIIKIVHQMSRNQGYSYAFYRDILLQSKSSDIFKWIEELAASEANKGVHLACLDILAGTTIAINHPFLRNDLDSPDPEIRLAALTVFTHNLQPDSMRVISKFLHDPNEKIRAIAISGMEYFTSFETINILTQALSDNSWMVRSQAAESLKRMGHLGRRVLEIQDPTINQPAYEAAQYALTFNW